MRDSRDATCGCCKSQYTYTPPTKPGYYWIRNVRKEAIEDGIVEVILDDDDLIVLVMGDDWGFELCDLDAEWCGPIVEPN